MCARVQRRRRAWADGGEAALASKGPVSLPPLSDELFAVLDAELVKGAVAHGWPDQTWALARIATLIGRRFHTSYTPHGAAALLPAHPGTRPLPTTPVRRGSDLLQTG